MGKQETFKIGKVVYHLGVDLPKPNTKDLPVMVVYKVVNGVLKILETRPIKKITLY